MLNVKRATSFCGVGAGVDVLFNTGCKSLLFHLPVVRSHAERRSARHRRVTLQVFLLALSSERVSEATSSTVS